MCSEWPSYMLYLSLLAECSSFCATLRLSSCAVLRDGHTSVRIFYSFYSEGSKHSETAIVDSVN